MKYWIKDQGPALLLIILMASVCIPEFFCVLADTSLSNASAYDLNCYAR